MKVKEEAFLPDPLQLPPTIIANTTQNPSCQKELTVEQEKVGYLENYLEKMKEDLAKLKAQQSNVGKPKEELLSEEIVHDVAVSEATAGKKKLPAMIPIKTIRLHIYGFNAFENKKFYKVKLDYDLFIEVNADNPLEAMEKVRKFAETELKGMGEIGEVEINEFMPQNCGMARSERQDF